MTSVSVYDEIEKGLESLGSFNLNLPLAPQLEQLMLKESSLRMPNTEDDSISLMMVSWRLLP